MLSNWTYRVCSKRYANCLARAEHDPQVSGMTAIVMGGRTGGAYAAEVAMMQGNEEIDDRFYQKHLLR